MKNVPKTFGNYERSLLHESTQLGFTIPGPDQVRPSDFAKKLKNVRNITSNIGASNSDENLTCADHEEADTEIIHHICNIDAQANFVIRCSDTDIAAIMLGNMHHLKMLITMCGYKLAHRK
ncbi:UNVERIFIED_CONTAM: hypothetical protein NCL1_12117 [Trichonephila clavipes]